MVNPLPKTALWDKEHSNDWKKWVERHVEICQYISCKEALDDCMKITKGKINPTMVIKAWQEKN